MRHRPPFQPTHDQQGLLLTLYLDGSPPLTQVLKLLWGVWPKESNGYHQGSS